MWVTLCSFDYVLVTRDVLDLVDAADWIEKHYHAGESGQGVFLLSTLDGFKYDFEASFNSFVVSKTHQPHIPAYP
jgi:hypothetical protein